MCSDGHAVSWSAGQSRGLPAPPVSLRCSCLCVPAHCTVPHGQLQCSNTGGLPAHLRHVASPLLCRALPLPSSSLALLLPARHPCTAALLLPAGHTSTHLCSCVGQRPQVRAWPSSEHHGCDRDRGRGRAAAAAAMRGTVCGVVGWRGVGAAAGQGGVVVLVLLLLPRLPGMGCVAGPLPGDTHRWAPSACNQRTDPLVRAVTAASKLSLLRVHATMRSAGNFVWQQGVVEYNSRKVTQRCLLRAWRERPCSTC